MGLRESQGREHPVPNSDDLILAPALKFGLLTGSAGLLFGGTIGLIRTTTPILFAIFSGLQCFALGSTFWASRGTILYYHYRSPPTRDERRVASTVAGGFTGATIGGLVRGRANILPATFMFSLFGFSGQSLYNYLDERHTQSVKLANSHASTTNTPPPNFWQRLAAKNWSPMKALSDEEYADVLRKEVLRIDAEIELLDEKIVETKKKSEELQGQEPRLENGEKTPRKP